MLGDLGNPRAPHLWLLSLQLSGLEGKHRSEAISLWIGSFPCYFQTVGKEGRKLSNIDWKDDFSRCLKTNGFKRVTGNDHYVFHETTCQLLTVHYPHEDHCLQCIYCYAPIRYLQFAKFHRWGKLIDSCRPRVNIQARSRKVLRPIVWCR